jgi:8-oxo-dGTP pyrophosphatase MutT (NUDIX family)
MAQEYIDSVEHPSLLPVVDKLMTEPQPGDSVVMVLWRLNSEGFPEVFIGEREDSTQHNELVFPGGKAENEKTLIDVASKEGQQEIGLTYLEKYSTDEKVRQHVAWLGETNLGKDRHGIQRNVTAILVEYPSTQPDLHATPDPETGKPELLNARWVKLNDAFHTFYERMPHLDLNQQSRAKITLSALLTADVKITSQLAERRQIPSLQARRNVTIH